MSENPYRPTHEIEQNTKAETDASTNRKRERIHQVVYGIGALSVMFFGLAEGWALSRPTALIFVLSLIPGGIGLWMLRKAALNQ
ncbi:MAG: hypothetical protein AAGI63_17225 [Planctomycetota bacterium]